MLSVTWEEPVYSNVNMVCVYVVLSVLECMRAVVKVHYVYACGAKCLERMWAVILGHFMYVCVTLFRTCVSCHIRSLYVCLCCTLFRMRVSCHVMPLFVCLCQSVFRMNIGCYTRSFPNNSAHLVSPDKTLPVPSSGFRNVVIVFSTGHDVKSPCWC